MILFALYKLKTFAYGLHLFRSLILCYQKKFDTQMKFKKGQGGGGGGGWE